MDFGCIDMGCVEKPRKETCVEKENSPKESASKHGKNNKAKDGLRSSLIALNKLASQISKPSHRKTSPINWFPRKKVEPYLKRKIKMLQEVDGMRSTLDETLGDSNPHYSKVLREKIAIREAAEKAMEARKSAMVEASWCRILQAARIESKEAEARLSKAELSAAEAFEAARAVGVFVNDIPESEQSHHKLETVYAKVGSTTHTVSAKFETAFEVDKQVACAVKAAFIKLANCPSISKDEFKELLHKISENPDLDENYSDLSELTSECESDAGSELKKHKKGQDLDKFSMTNIVDMMLGRLQCLKEDELASLATIVATRGLNAALAGSQNHKQDASEKTESPCRKVSRRTSSICGKTTAKNSFIAAQSRAAADGELPSLDKFLVKRLTRLESEVLEAKNASKNESSDGSELKLDKTETPCLKVSRRTSVCGKTTAKNSFIAAQPKGAADGELPSLDKFLVKRMSRLEREVLEAKNASKHESSDGSEQKLDITDDEKLASVEITTVPDLGSLLRKHSSKLQKEVEEARMNAKSQRGGACKVAVGRAKQDVAEVPSLDKYLVKHMTRLKREVQECRNRNRLEPTEQTTTSEADATKSEEVPVSSSGDSKGKENINLNKIVNRNVGTNSSHKHGDYESLDKALVKHVSRLEKEKLEFCADEQMRARLKRKETYRESKTSECSLDQVLVKHKSRLEREKIAAAEQQQQDGMRHSVSRQQARDRELQEAWGTYRESETSEGSLDQVLVKHKSRLEREKLAAAGAEQQQQQDGTRHSVSRRQARDREFQEAWGGLSLGNSIRPHVSRLQRDKAAWLKAEEEERNRAAMEEAV